MKFFKQKHLWIYGLVALVAYFSFLHMKTYQDFEALKKDETAYQQKIEYELAKQNELNRLEEKASSQKTIESIARGSLNYLKEGEILFVDSDRQ
ncbi:MAG: septum formation initiator family protein [Clostridia bacterium]|nr:septum formation initiator family protein [Clostridia bacterium]